MQYNALKNHHQDSDENRKEVAGDVQEEVIRAYSEEEKEEENTRTLLKSCSGKRSIAEYLGIADLSLNPYPGGTYRVQIQ